MSKLENKILALLPMSETALYIVLADVPRADLERALWRMQATGVLGRRQHEGRVVLVRRYYGGEHAASATRRHRAEKLEARHAA